MKRKLIAYGMAAVMSLTAACLLPIDTTPAPMQAAELTVGCSSSYDGSNIGRQNYYGNWASTLQSYLSLQENGYMRVQAGSPIEGVHVEYYNENFSYQGYKNIPAELPLFGGFYELEGNYYIVTGQANPNESNEVEVFRITKYDKEWNRLGSAGLYGANTVVPFEAGSLRMADCGKYLLIRTCHKMYKSSDGLNHQANVSIELDTEAMEIIDSSTAVSNSGSRWAYVSHSFNQFIQTDQQQVVSLDHGDAYPRSLVLCQYTIDPGTGACSRVGSALDVLTFPGTVGANWTGACAGGLEISDSSFLIAGNSVAQDENYLQNHTKNIFLAAVDKETSKVTVNWLTNYAEGSNANISNPHLVKIDGNRFLVLWSQEGGLAYAFVDGKGQIQGSIYRAEGELSDCVPQVTKDGVLWYTWKNEDITFYQLSLSHPEQLTKKTVQPGHTFVFSNVKDETATLQCSKCGKEEQRKVPVSLSIFWNTTGPYDSYSSAAPRELQAGQTLYYWNTAQNEADTSNELNIRISNPDVISWQETSTTMGYFKMLKPGSAEIEISYRWNPTLSVKKTFTVISNQTEEPEEPGASDKPTEPSVYPLGDANKDGKIDLADVQLILKASLSIIALDESQCKIADINKDQTISLKDAQIALQAVLHIIQLDEFVEIK